MPSIAVRKAFDGINDIHTSRNKFGDMNSPVQFLINDDPYIWIGSYIFSRKRINRPLKSG